jgi:hypothetical protein
MDKCEWGEFALLLGRLKATPAVKYGGNRRS